MQPAGAQRSFLADGQASEGGYGSEDCRWATRWTARVLPVDNPRCVGTKQNDGPLGG